MVERKSALLTARCTAYLRDRARIGATVNTCIHASWGASSCRKYRPATAAVACMQSS